MWLWWVLGAAVIAAVVLVVLRQRSRGPMNASRASPEQTLKRRYAKGELDRETYERMLQDLKQ